ncbi:MAG TPA: hypothetical protein VMU35_08545 [Methylomirabilota bacterium]|nr:hypothetical protein [Methylomirabilota bacterium]
MVDQKVINWLLDEAQPSARYHTLVDILGYKGNDEEARKAYSEIPRRGWAKDILKLQKPGGYWNHENLRGAKTFSDGLNFSIDQNTSRPTGEPSFLLI